MFFNHLFVYLKALLSSGPNYLIFFITGRCNLRCAHCFYLDEIEKADQKKELTLEEITEIAKRSPTLYHITFTGGETFLRNDLDEIVKLFYRYSHTRSITLTTNGTYPERVAEKVAEIARSCPLLIVRIPLSIDGTEPVHDLMRGLPGTWKKVLQTYESLRTVADRYSNVKIDVTSVLTQANTEDIESLIEYVKTHMTIDNHVINFPRGAMKDEETILPEEEKYREIIQNSSNDRKPHKYRFPIFSRILIFMRDLTETVIVEVQNRKKMPFICQAGKRLIEMNEYGELFPCEVLDTLIRNKETLHEPGFTESWMGNVRDHNYDISQVMRAKQARQVTSFIQGEGCACTFECAIGASLVFQPRNILQVLFSRLKSPSS